MGFLLLASSALADAPIVIPGTTKVDSYTVDASGNRTVVVEGQWTWPERTNCPTTRNGIGYQVAWFDGNTANPIGTSSSPNGVIYVGDRVDNIVHSLDTLNSTGDLAFNGIPASYLTHNLTSPMPTTTDLANWVSNCNTMDPVTKISTGTWGPISHTYPATFTGAIQLCPVVYDPHGKGTASGGVIGSSSLKDIIAGGSGHQTDNSYEGNGTGVNGNACLLVTIPRITTHASAGVVAGGQITDTATLSGGVSPTGTITFKLYKASDTACSTQIGSSLSTNVTNGNGNYSSPVMTPPAGAYQWIATYSGDQNNLSSSSACNDPNEQVTVSPAVPGIAVVKTQQLNGTAAGGYSSNPVSGHPGDTVDYKMVVTNTGNDALTTVAFGDPGCDPGTLSGPIAGLNLAVGASATFTCAHTLTNADLVAGSFTNTATAQGEDALGQTAGPVSSSVVANVTPVAAPGIAVTKTQQLNGTSAGGYTSNTLTGHPGDTVDYQMVVANTGNVSLTTSFSDPNCDSGSLAGSIPAVGGTLAGGASATFTCRHLLTSADLTAGSFINTATVSGVDLLGHVVGPVSSSVEVDVTPRPAPAISILKQQEVNGAGGFTASNVMGHPGDNINYKMTVTNTGNDTLTIAAGGFSDPGCDGGTLSGPPSPTTLVMGAQAVWTCTHTLTNADQTAGSFTNTARVQATDQFGTPVGPVSSSVVATVTPAPAPGIAVVKRQQINTTNAGGYVASTLTGHPGDTVNYQITVTNTGNDALSIVNLADPMCDVSTLSGPSGPLASGAQALFSCSHVLTAADLTVGTFTNTATATGQDQFGTGVGPVSSSVAVNVLAASAPGIAIVKAQRVNGTGSFTTSPVTVQPGDTINYAIQVANTGNVALTLSFSDPLCDANTLSGPTGLTNGTLAAGASAIYTCSHLVTVADVAAGSIKNTATATGTTATGTTVGPQSSTVTANVATSAGMTVIKAQQLAGSASGFTTADIIANVGQEVVYRIAITNTGNVPLSLAFTDPRCDSGTVVGPAGQLTSDGKLAAGGTAMYWCTHLITTADQTAGSLTNTVSVVGTPPTGSPVGPITASATANIPHAQPLGKCTIALGKVKLLGATGSQRKPFTASVNSFGVRRVVFYLDGKKYATASSARGGKFSVTIDPRKLSTGAHRVMARITFQDSNCATTNRAGVFVHPKSPSVVPPFTG